MEKSLFLDLLLYEIHLKLLKKKSQIFHLFLNAGFHIQHHYFFNSKANKSHIKPTLYVPHQEDPICEMYIFMMIFRESLEISDYQIIVATGLSQSPHHKITFITD